MDQVLPFLNEVMVFLRGGFNQVNAILGLLIALFAAFQLSSWRKLWEIALVAVLIHVVALMLAPVIANGAAIRLPPILDTGWLRNLAAIYVGYIVLIALFFFMRSKLMKPAAAARH
jgi:hypothetical protein